MSNNPWQQDGVWLKTALHLHSTESDGIMAPDALVGTYAEAGFDVISLTDHWKVTIVDAPKGTVVIPGAELAVNPMARERYSEFLAIGISEIPEDPGGDRQYWEPIDNYQFKTFPDYTTGAANVNEQGGVAFMCHPYWSGHTPDILLGAEGLAGIELFNSSAERDNGRGDSSYLWDLALERGMTLGGIATDDTHYPSTDVDGGWTMVHAAERSQEAVLQALRDGSYYASGGPSLLSVERDGGRLEVVCSPCFAVQVHSNWERGWYVSADHRNLGDAVDGDAHMRSNIVEQTAEGLITRATFELDEPGVLYYRIVLVDARGNKAWSNVL